MNALLRIKSLTINGPLETAGATIFTADKWEGGRNLGGKVVAVFADDAATFPTDDQIADAQALAHAANVLPGLAKRLEKAENLLRRASEDLRAARMTGTPCYLEIEADEIRQALSLATNVPVNS